MHLTVHLTVHLIVHFARIFARVLSLSTFGAVSILSISRGCHPRLSIASMRRISICGFLLFVIPHGLFVHCFGILSRAGLRPRIGALAPFRRASRMHLTVHLIVHFARIFARVLLLCSLCGILSRFTSPLALVPYRSYPPWRIRTATFIGLPFYYLY